METLSRLSEHIWYIPFEKETDRPILYYIKGERCAIAVDAGNSPAQTEKFYNAIRNTGFKLPEMTVISHWHWDHTFGLKAVKGLTIANELTIEKLREVQKWKWTKEAMKEREESGEDIPFCTECIQKEYPDLSEIEVVLPKIGFTGEMYLDLGGVGVDLYARGSTHTKDAVFVHVPADEVLIVEDGDCEDFYCGNIYRKEELENLLAFFEGLAYKWHCLGHAFPETKEEALERLKGVPVYE